MSDQSGIEPAARRAAELEGISACGPSAVRPPSGTWVGIAANTHSGIGQGRERVEQLVRALQARGLAARIAWTPDERHALVAGARPELGCRCLVAAGGDGTVAALINEQPAVPISVLKAGTENLFARHFGLSKRPAALASTMIHGRVLKIDLGQAGGRRFVLMAGCGFDAEVVTRHHKNRTRRFGRAEPTNRATYVEPVLSASLLYRFPPLTIRITDPGREETLVGTSAFLFNLPRYALGLPFAPQARGTDGWLDLIVFRDPGPFSALRYLLLVLLGSHLKDPGVYHRRVRAVTLRCDEPAPVQLDGDPAGTLPIGDSAEPWTAQVLPAALDVLAPASYART